MRGAIRGIINNSSVSGLVGNPGSGPTRPGQGGGVIGLQARRSAATLGFRAESPVNVVARFITTDYGRTSYPKRSKTEVKERIPGSPVGNARKTSPNLVHFTLSSTRCELCNWGQVDRGGRREWTGVTNLPRCVTRTSSDYVRDAFMAAGTACRRPEPKIRLPRLGPQDAGREAPVTALPSSMDNQGREC